MNIRNSILFLVLTFLGLQEILAQQQVDKIFQDHIQSVRLFPAGTAFDAQMDAPVIPLRTGKPLILLFDDIAYEPELYSAKLIHCDADWNQSQLKDIDFLSGFNEFNIQDYEYSVNTRIPYIHYQFELPQVTKSGNYVLKVYRGRDQSAVMFTKRFMVYEELFTVGADLVPPSETSSRNTSQQINVVVNYSKGDVVDPSSQIKVLLRQNQRWDNAKYLTKPTFMNESSKLLRYESFDGANTFLSGNEYRFVDLRFIRATGQNIADVRVEEDVIYADANVDQPRPEMAYSQYLDLNGQYIVSTNDRPGGDPEMESEYMLTTFRFSTPQSSDPIYLLGSLTEWGGSEDAEMKWNSDLELYETTLLLKQGWYDYHYASLNAGKFESQKFEGSHFQTENEYEVLVYFRALGSRYDQLVGFVYLHPNRRRL